MQIVEPDLEVFERDKYRGVKEIWVFNQAPQESLGHILRNPDFIQLPHNL